MSELSARLRLPLLVPGQGQKDVTHNEAIVALDMLVQPVVQSAALAVPPTDAEEGTCWLIPEGAHGAWAGRRSEIACWTAGGWRFINPSEGWAVWVVDAARMARLVAGEWGMVVAPGAPVVLPVGGDVVDAEARQVIDSLIQRLAAGGLI